MPIVARSLPVLLAAVLMTGCGQMSLLSTDANALGTAYGLASVDGVAGGKGAKGQKAGGPRGELGGKGGPGGPKGGPNGGPNDGPMGLFGLADLTDDQKTQIAAIEAKYRPAKPAADAVAPTEKPGAKLAELLKAETLDVEALKAALAERPEPKLEAKGDRTAQMAEIRLVLTEAQREAIAAKIEAMPAPASKDEAAKAARPARPTAEARVTAVATKLALTDVQQAALLAFETAQEANRPARSEQAAPDHAAHRAAQIAFWRTGDTTGLTAAQPPALARPAFPVDAFIALAQVLTPAQRAQLLGHGGPGGPGGKGGPGEVGGKGGDHGPGMGGPGRKGGDRGPGGKGGPAAPAAKP